MNQLIRLSLTVAISSLILSSLTACGDLASSLTGDAAKNTTGGNGSSNFPSHVKKVELKGNETVKVLGNLDSGQEMEDISWASSSSVACFPGTVNEKYRGKHMLFWAKQPPKSELIVTLKPDDASADFSLYAYQIGGTDTTHVVPNLPSAVTCEADPDTTRAPESSTRTVKGLTAINNPYNVVIGVSGPKGATGGFTLEFNLKQ